jgi:peptide/nickel transport system permease protein
MAIAARQISFQHAPAPHTNAELTSGRPSRSLASNAFRVLRNDRLTTFAASILFLFGVLAALAPVITNLLGLPANSVDLAQRFQAPSMAHPLGTDDFGRDQLARLLFGARVSLSVGFLAAAINLTLGVGLGLTAALYGGRVDDVISWLINTVRSIPGLFLVLIVASMFRVGPEGLAVIIGLTSWMSGARLVRGQALQIRELEYIGAARCVGATNVRILLKHLFPNVLPIAVVLLGIDVGDAILRESALSYLGLGIQPPDASWGNMLNNAQSFFTRAPWLVYVPGAVIAATVWCLFTLGDGLRDAFDPRNVR